jgi:hypothetical protein
MIADVNEIYLCILADKTTGQLMMKTAEHPYAAAMACYTDMLCRVEAESWDNCTELVHVFRVYSMESNIFGFNPELIGLDNFGNPRIPQGATYQKEGAIVMKMADSNDPIGFDMKFLPIATTINDITAN